MPIIKMELEINCCRECWMKDEICGDPDYWVCTYEAEDGPIGRAIDSIDTLPKWCPLLTAPQPSPNSSANQ